MFYLFVEGHGENVAAQKLIHKLIHHYQFGNYFFSEGKRWKNLHLVEGLEKAVRYAALQDDIEGVLLLRDSDDDCPKTLAPQIAGILRNLKMPFPIAYCLMYREFETLFVAYLNEFSGLTIPHLQHKNLTFQNNIPVFDNPESKRDAKGVVSDYLLRVGTYKPTVDQASITQALNIGVLETKNIPCFHTLVRCAKHLIENIGMSSVYPS